MTLRLAWYACAVAAAIIQGAGDDPLPSGALLRMGTVRFRHGGSLRELAFSHDGKRLASWASSYSSQGGMVIWDAASGKEIQRTAYEFTGLGA